MHLYFFSLCIHFFYLAAPKEEAIKAEDKLTKDFIKKVTNIVGDISGDVDNIEDDLDKEYEEDDDEDGKGEVKEDINNENG